MSATVPFYSSAACGDARMPCCFAFATCITGKPILSGTRQIFGFHEATALPPTRLAGREQADAVAIAVISGTHCHRPADKRLFILRKAFRSQSAHCNLHRWLLSAERRLSAASLTLPPAA